MTLTTTTNVLHGDWRRRTLSHTDAHLYRKDDDIPACKRRIPRGVTGAVHHGRPCTDCLVAEITR